MHGLLIVLSSHAGLKTTIVSIRELREVDGGRLDRLVAWLKFKTASMTGFQTNASH